MKLSLLIFSLLIFVENNVIGDEKQDDVPTLTLCKPAISEEELDSLSNLPIDVLKSLNDLKSRMGDNGKKQVDEMKSKIIGDLKAGNSTISNLSDVGTIAEHLDTILKYAIPTFLPSYLGILSDEADKSQWLAYNNTILPELQKRLEPFMKYEE